MLPTIGRVLTAAACLVCAGCGVFDHGSNGPYPAPPGTASSPSGVVIVPVTAVVDGDTFRVELNGHSRKVRIAGIIH